MQKKLNKRMFVLLGLKWAGYERLSLEHAVNYARKNEYRVNGWILENNLLR